MRKFDNHRPLLFLFMIILALSAFAFYPGKVNVMGVEVKMPDIFGDIRKDTTDSYMARLQSEMKSLDELDGPKASGKMLSDGTVVTDQFSGDSSGTGGIHSFLSALENEEYLDKPIRIAYYGDSEIEGDMITQDLREMLQSRYGGRGAGFLPVWAVDSYFRMTSRQRCSEDWVHSLLSQEKSINRNFGISGGVFNPGVEQSWAEFVSLNSAYRFSQVRLFYSSADTIPLSSMPSNFSLQDEQSGYYIKQLLFVSPKAQSSVKFSFNNPRANIFGVSLESGNGIYIDNFSLRGHSGTGLTRISTGMLREFSRYLDYRLIVLHFGMNVLNENVSDYSFYEKSMIRVIQHFKSAFPNASILVVGVGDKGTKVGEEYVTDLSVLRLIRAQKKAAAKTNVAFFDLFKSMGGANSMNNWVSKGLAAKDYIHISRPGSKILARSIYKYMVNEYQDRKEMALK